MCHTWQNPSRSEEEISSNIMETLPAGLKKLNLTGGEPALREDLLDIVKVLAKKTNKLDISTNGYFTERLVEIGKKFPNVAFRISVEGLPKLSDNLRGIKDGFDRALRTVLRLREVGVRDVGFGIVISDKNKNDLLDLYQLCASMGIEFGNSSMHNSFYFHKYDNIIEDIQGTVEQMHRFIEALLQSKRSGIKLRIKDWGRAYINLGILKHIQRENRLIPCGAGKDVFFLDPYGKILACNGSEIPWVMGDLREESFDRIWNSSDAEEARKRVVNCNRACWMVGTARPAMRKQPWIPLFWILKNKIKLTLGKNIWC
jgi:MoaA/NifB/PqqE/SkfB family radical SAM enzyme